MDELNKIIDDYSSNKEVYGITITETGIHLLRKDKPTEFIEKPLKKVIDIYFCSVRGFKLTTINSTRLLAAGRQIYIRYWR